VIRHGDIGRLDLAELRRVKRAAAALTPLEREVLVLSAGWHLRTRDLAAKLGISERRAERLLARALRKFDQAMERKRRPWWRFR
jgi:DNA-directed RNA polymerase specialized sigma24 family protein